MNTLNLKMLNDARQMYHRTVLDKCITGQMYYRTFSDDLQKHAPIKLQDVRAWTLKIKGLLT